MENADPLAPVLFRPIHETAKIGADNPDNYYQHAAISGLYEYRITGKKGTLPYIGFGTYTGNFGMSGSSGETGYLDGKELSCEPDGSFEIILSVEKKSGNWLPMKPETSSIIVRQSFGDRRRENIYELKIERIGGNGLPTRQTPESIENAIATSGKIILGTAALFASWAEGFAKHTNELPLFDQSKSLAALGDPNITYYHSYWRLGYEEALVIDFTPPDCELWNFQLNNHWMESLDYRYYQVWVNKTTAKYRDDGSIRIIVSHIDPEIKDANWIDTVGHFFGTMLLRWVKAKARFQPVTLVVNTASLKNL
jgi:hypothetical protein